MPTIFWAGDSTVKQNSVLTYPQTGIGQMFSRFTRVPDVRIENHAENGRSTKSFMDEGRLAVIAERIQPGDFLFIQFGHNDEKQEDPSRYADPENSFPANLRSFIDAARNRKATPVLITPVTRMERSSLDVKYHHDAWAESCRRTARQLDVALVDLTRMSEAYVDTLTTEERKTLYMQLPAGVYPAYPDGKTDRTHLQPKGAMIFAGMVARGLYELGGMYAELLCEGFGEWLSSEACFLRPHQGK